MARKRGARVEGALKPLMDIVNQIRDDALRGKVSMIIGRPTVRVGGRVYRGLPLHCSPGAKRHHHSYDRGLLEHTLASSRLALALCDVVESIYGGAVDRDIVLSSIILHDLFKALIYVQGEAGSFDLSELAHRVDHHTLMGSELIRRGFPIEVVHAVLGAHGKYGPIAPRSVEALITHLADIADANLVEETLQGARFAARDCLGFEPKRLTAKQAFQIVRMRRSRGCEGVKEAFQAMEEAEEAP